jgi:SurA N-terminal domain
VRPRAHGWLLALAVLILVLLVPAAPSAGEAAGPCPPAPSAPAAVPPAPSAPAGAAEPAPAEPAPDQILACVGSEAITGGSFSHWVAIDRDSQTGAPKGQPVQSAAEAREEVLQFLISSGWVLGEARDLNISVSVAQVRRDFDRVKAQQFPKTREFRAFLRSSGQTVADLLFRVRLNLLSDRIERHVSAGRRGSHKQQALSRFVKAFEAKWRQRTYCAPPYVIAADCGHVQSIP